MITAIPPINPAITAPTWLLQLHLPSSSGFPKANQLITKQTYIDLCLLKENELEEAVSMVAYYVQQSSLLCLLVLTLLEMSALFPWTNNFCNNCFKHKFKYSAD